MSTPNRLVLPLVLHLKLVLIALAVAMGIAGGALAQPANDRFANRTTIAAPGTVLGTTVGATVETGQPILGGSSGRPMVWWTFTPTQRGRLTVDTCGSGVSTFVGVYTGALGNMPRIGESSGATGCTNGGRVTFHTEAGVAYQIGVAGFSNAQGSVRVSVGLVPSPANDLFRNRITIPDVGSVSGNNTAATAETGQPALGGSSTRPMVWWTFTPRQRGRMTVDTCNSGVATYLGVYTGALGNMPRIGESSSGTSCPNGGRVTFHTEAGVTYQIGVAGFSNAEGAIRVSIGLEPSPGNDLFQNRIRIPDLRTVAGNNIAATVQDGQPSLGGSRSRNAVWWTYTTEQRGRLTIETCGSSFSSMVGVYTGGTLTQLTTVAESGSGTSCPNGGRVTFHTEAGVTYQIAVAGFSNAEGQIRLALSQRASPANDLFANRVRLTGTGTVTGDNTASTVQDGQPALGGSRTRPTVWWTYTAPQRGRMTVETCGSSFSSMLGVYTGSTLTQLTMVAESGSGGSCPNGGRAVFQTEANVTYQIAVAGFSNAEGAIRLTLGLVPAPANDLFVNRAAIASGSTVQVSNIAATAEPGQPSLGGSAGRKVIWWTHTAPSSGQVTIQSCGSSMSTLLGVYTGGNLAQLTRVAESSSAASCANGGRVSFAAQAGVAYHVAVAGFSNAEGHIVLSVAPPAGRVQTTTALTGPAASTQGQPVTLTATVRATAGTPTGRVSFRIGAQEIAAGNLNAQGVVSATISTLPAGQHQIAAIYQGAGNFQPSGSGFLTHTVAASNSATMLSGPSNSDPGDRVTFTATVNSGAGVPTGTVSFRREGVQFATGTLNAQGVATTSTTGLSVGRQQITAHYLGAGLVRPSASVPLIHTVLGAAVDTTTSLSGPASSTSGQSVSFTAQVRAASGTPGGTVSFRQGGTQFATGTLNAQGNVTVSVNTLPVGTLQITAHYLGGQGFNPSASAPLSHRVDSGAVDTTTTLTGPASVLQGQPAAFTARVAATAGTPTGTVSFRRDGAQFATGALNAQGVATTSVSNLPLGTHTITAHYLGATGFRASASGPLGVNVVHPRPDFSGGGAIFALTDQCAPILGSGPHAVGIHYAPSELGGLPSGVSLVWREGSEHLALWGPMLPSGNFFGAAGRATWSRFVFYPLRPLVRVVQRQITVPAGGTNLVQAEELVLRMRVQNFAAVPGCAVTVAATVRRNAVQEQAVEPVRLFSIGNIAAVSNGPTRPSEFTVTRSVMMTRLQTYHWNSARGSTPGTIGLQRLSPDTATLGPWQASGQPGMGGVPNANWIVEQRMILPPGRYRVVDSNPATWSHNAQSNNMGFFELWGYELD